MNSVVYRAYTVYCEVYIVYAIGRVRYCGIVLKISTLTVEEKRKLLSKSLQLVDLRTFEVVCVAYSATLVVIPLICCIFW